MAATLTKAALDKVFVGISKIELAPIAPITATTFDDADQIFTVRDSVSFSQAQPTKTEINVDQFSAPIAATYEAGEFTITGNIPSVAKAVLQYFFKVNATAAPAITGFAAGTAIDLENKIVNAMVKITNQAGTMAIVIPRCEFIANFDWSSTSTTALATAFTATPKVNPSGTGEILVYDTVAP